MTRVSIRKTLWATGTSVDEEVDKGVDEDRVDEVVDDNVQQRKQVTIIETIPKEPEMPMFADADPPL